MTGGLVAACILGAFAAIGSSILKYFACGELNQAHARQTVVRRTEVSTRARVSDATRHRFSRFHRRRHGRTAARVA